MKPKARRKSAPSRPTCVFCKRDTDVQFAMFTPRFPPFGTACVECEASLPPGTTVPQPEPERPLGNGTVFPVPAYMEIHRSPSLP